MKTSLAVPALALAIVVTLALTLTNSENISAASAAHCEHDTSTLRCVHYVRNYDGDTITFDIPNVHPLMGKSVGVRVRHVDTPEIKGKAPCEKDVARTAKRLIENLLKSAKTIHLKNVDRDKYFRILADVEVDGKDLKEILFKNHVAYRYEGDTKRKINWCQRKTAAE